MLWLVPGARSPMTARRVLQPPTAHAGFGNRKCLLLPPPPHSLPAQNDPIVQQCTDAGKTRKKCHLVPLSGGPESPCGSPIARHKPFQDHHLACLCIHPSASRTRRAAFRARVPHQRSLIVHYREPAAKDQNVNSQTLRMKHQTPNTDSTVG